MRATKGAMALALINPEPEKGGRGDKTKNLKETLGFSSMRLSQARTVLRFSRELALAMMELGTNVSPDPGRVARAIGTDVCPAPVSPR